MCDNVDMLLTTICITVTTFLVKLSTQCLTFLVPPDICFVCLKETLISQKCGKVWELEHTDERRTSLEKKTQKNYSTSSVLY